MGTPEQVNLYSYTFLFDLDGTLVNTDHIYIEVWKVILKEYNITCNKDFFDIFVKGNSDNKFLNYLSN